MTTSHPRRQHLTAADLAPLAREAVGGHRALLAATRLTGGTSKGVYRLAFDDGSTAIAYVWSPQEDYWAPPADALALEALDLAERDVRAHGNPYAGPEVTAGTGGAVLGGIVPAEDPEDGPPAGF